MNNDTKRLLTIKQLAEELQVNPRTIRNYRKLGLPYMKITAQKVLYDLEEVILWMKSKKEVL